ncbi:V-type proton ATPase 116 kDa subunit a 1-like [Clytia hemisphaerica]|uniref:V-type proton ATPase subunit a n=1 Tax=Clytia hemisphaerica TaxID=252671 RepID=A0A7M5V179_9CNID
MKESTLFRSEEMKLCQLYLQTESAYGCVSELGEIGLVEFRDLNPNVNAFQRKFVAEVRRCDEMERKLRFMLKEIDKAEILVQDNGENPEAPHPNEMMELEDKLEQLEKEMKESNINYEQLQKTFMELNELKCILRKTQSFFEEAEHQLFHDPVTGSDSKRADDDDDELSLLAETGYATPALGGRLGFVAGVIQREKVPGFERLLWRACRGNVFFKHTPIDEQLYDPSTGDVTYKSVFIIFFQGDQLKSRVKKICEGFKATLYPCPETSAERREMVIGVATRIEDVQAVLNQTQDHRHRLLQTIAKNMNDWLIKVKKIKAIYHTMNMFNIDVTSKALIAECWAPVADLDHIHHALDEGTRKSGSAVPSIIHQMKTRETPPTFNRTNKFTNGFQAIIDAYGVADYQEVNPSLYAIITFPFLFSVMFGDFGHGIIMSVFAYWMIKMERKLNNWKGGGEMFDMIFSGRYVILLMGLFSIYSGLIYNDIFSKSLRFFDSPWTHLNVTKETDYKYNIHKMEKLANSTDLFMFNPLDVESKTPYLFGLDPIWQLATNKLTFTNSLKMKLSVIFGVTHMTFGVILGLLNHWHFKDPLKIWFEFVPQLLFISCIFGYLVIVIFYKWVAFDIHSQYQPSILLGLIGMFLHFGAEIKEEDLLYSGQQGLQPFLVVVAVLSVPVMLLGRPLILRYRNKNGHLESPRYQKLDQDDDVHGNGGHVEIMHNDTSILGDDGFAEADDDVKEEPFDFGEIFITQAIHTIEYCLGCISNTASYLRLWALSLAHAQLSEVLWSMVFKMGLGMNGGIGSIAIFLFFGAWAALTIGILLIMEGLSAFLHTLRLHWVEFNGKFYHGTGIKFAPFCFKTILKDAEDV